MHIEMCESWRLKTLSCITRRLNELDISTEFLLHLLKGEFAGDTFYWFVIEFLSSVEKSLFFGLVASAFAGTEVVIFGSDYHPEESSWICRWGSEV